MSCIYPMQKSPRDKLELLRTNAAVSVTVCRLCMLSVTDDSCMETNIFRCSENNCSIADKIASVTCLTLFEGDGLPTTVCQQCIFQLNNAESFIQKCALSHMSFQSRIISGNHEIISDCTNPVMTTCNQAMPWPLSEDFLLALEYIVSTQKTDLDENFPPRSNELQVPENELPRDLEECLFLELKKLPEYSADLDEVGDIPLAMEDFGELPYAFFDSDLDASFCNALIEADNPHLENSDMVPLSVEQHSEPPVKVNSTVEITSYSGHASSGSENSYPFESKGLGKGNQDHVSGKNLEVVCTTLSEQRCQPTLSDSDKKHSPSTTQNLNSSAQRTFSGLTFSKKRSANKSATPVVCCGCSSNFSTNTTLMTHKATRACERKLLKLQDKKSQLLNKSSLAKGTPIKHFVLDSNLKEENSQGRERAKVFMKTLSKLNSVETKQFKCIICGLAYNHKQSLVTHMKKKHQ